MSSRRKNTFARAVRHIKSTKFDVVEAAPVNSTSGLMTVTPNAPNPDYVPPNYPPAYKIPNFDTDNQDDGKDTTGLFAEDGTPKTSLPPVTESSPDRSYILGPMASMWYAWANATRVGYIRQSDRKMVNLGSITGKLSDWDGASGFTSYGQLTLEQTVWYKNVAKAPGQTNDPATANYRAFYPGPPSNSPDSNGRYYCTITGQPLDEYSPAEGEPKIPPVQGEMSPDDNHSAQEKGKKKKPKPDRDDYPPGRAGAKKYQDDLNKWKDEQKEEGGEEKPDKEPSDYKSPKDRGGQGGNDQEWRDKGDKTGDAASDPASDYTAPKDRGGQGDTDGVDPNEPGLLDKAKEAWDWYVDNREAVDAAAGSVMNAVDAAMAIASVVGVIFPEAGTSIAGALGIASLTSKMKKAYNAVKAGKSVADVIGGKNKGLSGAGSFDVGATGVKKGGFDALNPNQVGPKAQHKGSKGLLSPGGGEVYSAPKVGEVGPSAVNPGTGAAKYTKHGSNPFSQSSQGGGVEGGAIGSLTHKGAKSIGVIEPQSTQTPAQFNKSSKIFNDIMNGKYQNSPTAQKIYQKGIDAGFTTGGGSIKFSDIPKQTSLPNVGKTQGNLTKFVSTKGKMGESFNYLIENNSKKEIKLQGDKEDIMIMHLLKKPEILKKLPLIIKGLELETEIADAYGILFGYEDKSVGKKKVKESNSLRKVKFVVEDVNGSEKTFKEPQGKLLSESKRSIIKNLKKPVVIPETKQKSYKVKPKIRGLENTAIVSKPVETPKEYKKIGGRHLWGQYEYQQNVRQSQERMNDVLELVGEGDQAFKYMITDSKRMNSKQLEEFWGLNPEMHSHFYNGKKYKVTRKEQLDGDHLVFLVDENGVKSNILQSELNEKLAEEDEKRLLDEYNKINPKSKRNDRISYDKDPLFKKAYKKLMSYKDKPAVMGYPNDPPPKMVNGWHPEYGKRYKYDKLDPISAKAMPPTGNPEIDANVEKAKRKPK